MKIDMIIKANCFFILVPYIYILYIVQRVSAVLELVGEGAC